MPNNSFFVRIVVLAIVFPLMTRGMEENKQHTKEIIKIFKGPAPKKKKNMSADYFAKELITKVRASYESSNPDQNSLILNANILTYEPLVKELKKAHDKGVSVKILLAQKTFQYNKDFQDQYTSVPTYVYTNKTGDNEISQDHAKLFIYDIDGKKGYGLGSSNSSPNGLFRNSEINQVVEQDDENYEQLLKDVDKLQKKSVTYDQFCKKETSQCSPLRLGNQTLKDTPEKQRTVYTTLDKNFISLLLDRLDAKKFSSGDSVWLSTYTFNSKKMTQALIKLLKKGVNVYLYFDKNPLGTDVGFKQVEELLEGGAITRVYSLNGNQQYIHHAKFLLIHRKSAHEKSSQDTDDSDNQGNEKKEKKITIISTQNMLASKAFDALSFDQNDETFEAMQDYIKEYDSDQNFKMVTLENMESFVPSKKSKKRLFSDEDVDDEEDEHDGYKSASSLSQHKKTKN